MFADQAFEDLPALDPDGVAWLAQRRFLLQPLVRTMPVVVPRLLGQDTAEMPFAEVQRVVQALARSVPANRSAKAFARGDGPAS